MIQIEKHNNTNINNLNEDELKKIFLASDFKMYLYLYLERYIHENDRLLDIEGGYGTGANLLAQYTSIDQCTCLNSINFYTQIGSMYYSSDFIKFVTGNIYDITQKFNIVCFFDDRKTQYLTIEELNRISKIIEFNGIFALAFKMEAENILQSINYLKQNGFCIEEHFFQSQTSPSLEENPIDSKYEIYYLRKNA